MSDQGGGDDGVLEVRLREVSQLFDEMDPAPFRDKGLNHHLEEYLVDSVKELPSRVLRELVLYIDHAPFADGGETIGAAIHDHFSRRSTHLQRELRRLLRRGFVSLIIGLSFLAVMLVTAQVLGRLLGELALARILREGLLIIGWVAMWKPLEILLYDWWPILAERRLFDRLSRIRVRIVAENSR